MTSAAFVLFLIGCAGVALAQTAGAGQPAAEHSAAKAAADASARCAACHAEIAQQFEGSAVTHSGKGVTCASCHALDKSHGESGQAGAASRQKLDAAADQKATCSQCHAEIAGPFAHEHPVIAAEGCVSCHAPHGSANAAMLTKSDVNATCAQCHLPEHANGGPRAAANQTTQVATCTSCHTQIHGSNTSEVFIK
jgi:predicted CXXCH cytochrome family protein